MLSQLSVMMTWKGGKRETESVTHHNRNNGKLYNRHQGKHACDQRPARFALVFAALHDDQEGDETGQAHYGGQ